MRRLQQKRSIAKFLCFLLILEIFVASPNVAEASVSKTISKNGREYCAVEGNKQTITVTLASPTKPENTKVDNSSVPGWASVSKPNYNSPVFKVTVQQNNSGSTRVQNIKFTDGTNTWTLTLTQYIYTTPTPTKKPTTAPKPTTKPVTKEPSKKATPVPTAVPSNTPTPAPAETLPIGRKTMQFSAQGGQDTLSLQGTGYSLTFSFPDNPSVPSGWVGMIYDGNTITVKVNKNADYAPRSIKVKITDNNTKQYAYVTINQSAAPTPTPTPAPAETLPINRTKMQFGAQGGQDTLSLSGTGYNLTFSFTDNPSVPGNWVGMVYDGNQIKVSVERNKDYAPRSMKVKISDSKTNQYAYVTINQSAAPTPTPAYLSADRREIPCDSKGGEETVTLKGKVGVLGYGFAWEPSSQTDWVKVKTEGNKVRFTIDENRTIRERTATIRITDSTTKKDVSVTIKQKAMPNTSKVTNENLRVEPGKVSFGYAGGEESVKIYGKVGALRSDAVGEDTSWFSASLDGITLTISAKENEGYARRGYLDITDTGNGESFRVEVYQDARPVRRTLEIDHRALTFSSSKETKTVIVSGRAGSLVFGRRNNDTWFTVKEEKGSIIIEVTENDGAPRTGYLDITDTGSGESVWVAIYQNSKSMDEQTQKDNDFVSSLSIDGLRCNYGWEKCTDQVPLNSHELLGDFFYDWNREDVRNWARVWYDGENLCIEVDENKDTNYRSVVVSIYGPLSYLGQITITQDGTPIPTPQLKAYPYLLNFGTNGGTQETHITGLSGSPMVVKKKDAPWLTIKEEGTDKDGYRITFTVPENDGPERKVEVQVIEVASGRVARIGIIQTAAPGYENVSKQDSNEEVESDESSFKNEYLVQYDANGGSNPPSSQIRWHSTDPNYALILTTDKPKRLGFDFVGWGLTPASEYPAYLPGDKYTKNADVTLYAIWKSNGFWDRFEVTAYIHEPKNSAVDGASQISMHQYWLLYRRRTCKIHRCVRNIKVNSKGAAAVSLQLRFFF